MWTGKARSAWKRLWCGFLMLLAASCTPAQAQQVPGETSAGPAAPASSPANGAAEAPAASQTATGTPPAVPADPSPGALTNSTPTNALPSPPSSPAGDSGVPAGPTQAQPGSARPQPQASPPPPLMDDAEAYGAVALVPSPQQSTALRHVPRNVLVIGHEQVERQHPLGLHGALELRLGSVIVNDVQNNPLQPDLQYRGFTASPLLGTPQGLAVYQNGVRINDAFGDVLQWDLVPTLAIDETQVLPGANPLYGLNALGGALALQMKHGFKYRGTRVSALAGSFGRHQVDAELGMRFDDWAVYAAASYFGEEGFRDHSRSHAHSLYADLRHRSNKREVGLNATIASSDLNGNALAPVELLADEGRSAVYTFPDNTQNQLLMAAADLTEQLAHRISLSATAYLRHQDRDTVNGDEAEFATCTRSSMSVLCTDEGTTVLSEQQRPIAVVDAYDGLYHTTESRTNQYGGSVQLKVERDLLGGQNQLLLGASADVGDVAFLQRAEVAYLTAERSVVGQGTYLADDSFRTRLRAQNYYWGAFFSNTWSPSKALSLQVSARVNWARLRLDDQGPSTALDGAHRFVRLNPAVGITYSPNRYLTVFGSYSESNRTPSAAELACADPAEPCRLPNAFVADPPLRQVVSRGVELGVRGQLSREGAPTPLRWSLAGFAIRNFDDIIFVSGSRIGTGYFRNAGKTQRLGIELDLQGERGPLQYFLGYAYLSATYQSTLTLPSAEHPLVGGDDNDDEAAETDESASPRDGTLTVTSGDRIPGLPAHSLKAGLSIRVLPTLELGASSITRSGSPFRGDEANLLADLGGYTVLSAYCSYDLLEQLQLFVKIQNILQTDHETFGVLADPSEVLPNYDDPRFVSPGAGLSVFAGVVVRQL